MPTLKNIRRDFASQLFDIYRTTSTRQAFVYKALELEDTLNVEVTDAEELLNVVWYVLDSMADKMS